MFILASASARRQTLLARLGVVPDQVVPPNVDESPLKGELPRPYVERLARNKALFVHQQYPEAVVLSADTVVACGRRILPKADDYDIAKKCLRLLSGRRHLVMTSICLFKPNGQVMQRTVKTFVYFKRLSQPEIEGYLATNQWTGKAGGYAIQDSAECLVIKIQGSHANIIGLPLYETRNLLIQGGIDCVF